MGRFFPHTHSPYPRRLHICSLFFTPICAPLQVFGGRSWSLTGMLKERGHKASAPWKSGVVGLGVGSHGGTRAKKKSYGNIHRYARRISLTFWKCIEKCYFQHQRSRHSRDLRDVERRRLRGRRQRRTFDAFLALEQPAVVQKVRGDVGAHATGARPPAERPATVSKTEGRAIVNQDEGFEGGFSSFLLCPPRLNKRYDSILLPGYSFG